MNIVTMNPEAGLVRAAVFELEAHVLRKPQIYIPIERHFCEGVYARKMTMPADSVVTGKIHLHSQINIISKGHMAVFTGTDLKDMFSGDHLVCEEGAKRAFYAHEESVWTVILRCDRGDVENIDQDFVVETEQQYIEFQKRISA